MEVAAKITAEQVKQLAAAYADAALPGWVCIGISIRVGDLGASATETLVVLSRGEGASTPLLASEGRPSPA